MSDMAWAAVTVACLVVLFVEVALEARWNPQYFRSGILLFRQRVASTESIPRIEEELNLTFERDFWAPLTFRQLGDGSVAFRERLSPLPLWLSYYLPLMHGRVRTADDGQTEVSGRSNWAVPLIWAVVTVRTLMSPEASLAAVSVVFLGVMYALQAFRFRQVGRIVAASEERAA